MAKSILFLLLAFYSQMVTSSCKVVFWLGRGQREATQWVQREATQWVIPLWKGILEHNTKGVVLV